MRINLEPSQALSSEQQAIVAAFFSSQVDSPILEKAVYAYEGHEIVLNHRVLRRAKKTEGFCYEFFTEEQEARLGKGTGGQVYRISASFNPSKAFKQKNRVIKVLNLGLSKILKVEREFLFTKRLSHLAIKPPVITAEKSYLVMRWAGLSLQTLIDRDRKGEIQMDLFSRYCLSLSLLKALKEQLIDKNIMHCDIKTENILVDGQQIRIIDFGLSRDASDQRSTGLVGTPGFMAPEVLLRRGYRQASDLYSMARVIALVWRGSFAMLIDSADYSESEDLAYACSGDHQDLFQGLDLPQPLKTGLHSLIKSLLAAEPGARPTVEEAIDRLEQLLLLIPVEAFTELPLLKRAELQALLPIPEPGGTRLTFFNANFDLAAALKVLLDSMPAEKQDHIPHEAIRPLLVRYFRSSRSSESGSAELATKLLAMLSPAPSILITEAETVASPSKN